MQGKQPVAKTISPAMLGKTHTRAHTVRGIARGNQHGFARIKDRRVRIHEPASERAGGSRPAIFGESFFKTSADTATQSWKSGPQSKKSRNTVTI